MEQVWKELSLSSLRYPSTAAAAAPPVCGPSLQEILDSPLKKSTANFGSETENFSSFNALTSGLCACAKREICSAGVDENASDRKKKRLIKNRESASRSRARKQAYTHELELAVAHLMEENAKLRKEQEKIYAPALGYHDGHDQKKQKLYRTLTAPF